ncbi:BON domain-containing protein [Rhizobium straminoryzae]|uniref:BON domain-containing protein n=1 Tax=Rhizobium straminoryzae TaxID=1387186 RepID=A0A549TA70_9HYPH|nr:BON domain-containing protein [Rhizobium straminoryzae]TRL38766.1 BON domain-containing protein [Rhizobium straminoryzae]
MVFKPQTFHAEQPVVTAENPPDAQLETRVAEALASAGGLDPTNLAVTVEGTTVILTGSVLLPGESDRAAEVALSVAGVTSVTNHLRASGTF